MRKLFENVGLLRPKLALPDVDYLGTRVSATNGEQKAEPGTATCTPQPDLLWVELDDGQAAIVDDARARPVENEPPVPARGIDPAQEPERPRRLSDRLREIEQEIRDERAAVTWVRQNEREADEGQCRTRELGL